MSKTKNEKDNIWNLTEDQYKILQNCAKVNSILYFNGKNKSIVSTNALDEAFTIFYLNTNFNFPFKDKEFVVHNINEIIKTLKMIEKGKIKIDNDKIIISDSEDNIKCRYLYANTDIIENIKTVYENYNEIVNSIKKDAIKINFKKEYFSNVKKFFTPNFNTISIQNNKIVLFDNIGSNNIDIKDTIEIALNNVEINNRFDIDILLFKIIDDNDYDCYLSSAGFVLFENTYNGNIYGIATNIVES